MLESLHIENIAVVKSVDIDLAEGLCVLTGETGAGKSLLIDSVNCLTGGRVSRELIRTGEDRALISAVFSPPEGEIAAGLAELGIDLPAGDSLMLQRVITRDGRDVTPEYRRGGEAALQLARLNGASCAILKARSPSCGKGIIYDGTFTGQKCVGNGIAAGLLMDNGCPVYTEDEVEDIIF